MVQPTLHSARITLVPLADSHLELEVELDSDPEVMRFLTGRPMRRDEVVARHVDRLADGRHVDGLGYWVGYWVGFARGEFVGWWILSPFTSPAGEVVRGVAGLGYRVRRSWWGQGVASKGARVAAPGVRRRLRPPAARGRAG